MQYKTLYEAWKREQDSSDLQPLAKGFYSEAGALMRAQRDEAQMVDERSLHAQLLARQQARSERLLTSLLEVRFKKICDLVLRGQTPSRDLLSSEEEAMVSGMTSVKAELDSLMRAVLGGRPLRASKIRGVDRPRRAMVRFLQDIPSIVGSNAKIYGPFKAEDIATLPEENAESLIKRGVALRVEVE